MPKPNKQPKIERRPKDVNQLAHYLGRKSTEEKPPKAPERPTASKEEISFVMATLGRRGGKIGGKRRLITVTPERRKEIALKAAKARWEHKRKEKTSQLSASL